MNIRAHTWLSRTPVCTIGLFLSIQMTATFSQSQDLADKEWSAQIDGTNLAAGKEAWLFPAPNWGGQKPQYYAGLLSDEKLSANLTFGSYEAGDAVRWAWSDVDCVIMFDLGQSEPVEKLVARFYGGQKGGEGSVKIAFPRKFEVLVSEDGKHFHSAANLEKTLPAEQDTADWKRTYYLEEKNRGYPHIFSFPVGVKCRYIGLRVGRDRDKVIADEVAVIRGAPEITKVPSELPQTVVAMNSAAANFRTQKLYLTPAIATPNWLVVQDTREKQTEPIEVTLEVPDTVEVVGWRGAVPQRESSAERPGTSLYKLSLDLPIRQSAVQGPLYLRKSRNNPLPEDTYAILTTQYGGQHSKQQIPLAELDIKEVPDWSGFEISLGWMWDEWILSWPEFFKNYRFLGFNTIPTFPRYYQTPPLRFLASYTKQQKLAFLEKGRAEGFKILYNESPFHVLFNKRKTHPEILNQVGGKPGNHLSPVYRGPLYAEEIDRVARHFSETKADLVFLDIELWNTALSEARQSPEYKRTLQASGKSEHEFLAQLGEEMIRDIHAAIARKAAEQGLRMPGMGLYGFGPGKGLQQGIFDWEKLFPQYLNFSMPSLYVAGDVNRVHQVIARNRERIGAAKIIPWLTAGTYGAFPPPMLEFMIYETLLNGASGFTYYWYPDFDPELFLYHAKALRTLHPFKDLLKNGAPLPVSGTNETLDYTAFGDDSHRLILIGNYKSERPQQTRISIPGENVSTIRDIRTGANYPASPTVEVTVEGRSCALLEVR